MPIQEVAFAVASDESTSGAFSEQRLLNLYPETSPTRAKSRVAILGRPGLRPFATSGTGATRGSHTMAGVQYVVSGMNLYAITQAGTSTLIGSAGTVIGDGLVVMADNGFQLAIATGNAWVDFIDGFFLWGRDVSGQAYLYDSEAGTFGPIADADLFIDGNGKFQLSALNDGSSYDALDFATAEATPTPLIRGYVDRADVFLFKPDVTEVWFDSGNADFPFEPRNQTVIPKGIMGRDVVCSIDNSVFFVGRDGQAGGSAIVYRLGGFEAQRVSTHAVEKALSAVSDWSTARCIGYIVNGHAFMAIILADAPAWVYDCATQLWHEDSTYDLGRWLGASHSYAYGKHLIGSASDGAVYEIDPEFYLDGTTRIEREMISAPFGDDAMYKVMGFFQADMETGTGLLTGQGQTPMVELSYSDDRGKTFGNTRFRSFGRRGEHAKRVIWRQLGRFRSRVLKLRVTDPVKVAFLDYFAGLA